MELTKELFEKSCFTFYFGKRHGLFENYFPFSNHFLHFSPSTACTVKSKENKTIGIVGICVDAHAEIGAENIVDFLLDSAENAQQLIEISKRFAGKYVIFSHFGTENEYIICTDAAAMLSVYYYTGDEICISSLEYLVAKAFDLEISAKSLSVMKNGQNPKNIIFPNDMTRYDQVKCLLPNHYLNTKAGKAVRFYPNPGDGHALPVSQAVERTIELTQNIISQYAMFGDFLCALTGGWDSRLVMALLNHSGRNVLYYTSMQDGFTEKSDDVWIPEKIANMLNLDYRLINDLPPPREMEDIGTEFFGGLTGVKAAFTQQALFGNRITISGDIVGQMGKGGIGGTMPRFLGAASYFRCKLHNFSKETTRELKKWQKGAKAVQSPVTLYDLFALENRCGRWAAKTENAFSLLGNTSLNIINCREIIETWICVDRKDRIHKELHKALYRALSPSLLEMPCNPSSIKSQKIDNPFILWLGSYLDYYYHKIRRGRRRA